MNGFLLNFRGIEYFLRSVYPAMVVAKIFVLF